MTHYRIFAKSTGRYVGNADSGTIKAGYKYLFTGKNRGLYILRAVK